MASREQFDQVTPGGTAAKLAGVAVGTAIELLPLVPGAGAAAAVGTEVLGNIVGAHLAGRRQRALEAVEAGAAATNRTIDAVWAAVAEDPQRLELVGRALVAAGRATTTEKVTALGRALFTGALADAPSTVDAEAVFINAMAVLDAPHIKVLSIVSKPGPGHRYAQVSATSSAASAWSPEELREAYPGVGASVSALLATLASVGAIVDVAVGTLDYWPTWAATDFGHLILRRLTEAATE